MSCVSRPGWFRFGARVEGADPGGGGGSGRALRQPGDVQPQRQRAGDGGDRQHPQHTQTQAEVTRETRYLGGTGKVFVLILLLRQNESQEEYQITARSFFSSCSGNICSQRFSPVPTFPP